MKKKTNTKKIDERSEVPNNSRLKPFRSKVKGKYSKGKEFHALLCSPKDTDKTLTLPKNQ